MKEVILVPLCSAVDLERLCDNAIAELKKDKKKVVDIKFSVTSEERYSALLIIE